MKGLDDAYSITSAEEAKSFYDGWAEGYEDELAESGYLTPQRCAEALSEHASMPWAPLAEFGCGTGLGGLALKAAGFECIDGYDISEEMLSLARAKDIYQTLDTVDLSQPLDGFEAGTYQNAAAIGVLNPAHMPTTVIDEILALLPEGGCLVFSLNDKSIADGSMESRILALTEYNVADLMFKDHGDHLPGIDLQSTVYVLRKR
ncbi:MAG: methyltransferase domain-containing protein [Pseudomonadota bacterium]